MTMLPTSTSDHGSHLHHQNPTPALPTTGEHHHHRLLGSPTLPHHEDNWTCGEQDTASPIRYLASLYPSRTCRTCLHAAELPKFVDDGLLFLTNGNGHRHIRMSNWLFTGAPHDVLVTQCDVFESSCSVSHDIGELL
ncbi:uncharacterized protein LOC131298651 [Rhododendron vialii]|uniref:uncharacterized protein LOC131298651 n=1 Tax=Rhododendron vialii TaxID=182163 RepID=UPI00265F9312|nr:uncharacterized protein LOC131298651 [Rhododendron vialii]